MLVPLILQNLSGATTAPVILANPQNQSILSGTSGTFAVVASGLSLTYQWTLNGVNISGATASTYTTPPENVSASGSVFACVVTNAGGSVTSTGATLTVIAGTTIVTSNASPNPTALPAQGTGSDIIIGALRNLNVLAAGETVDNNDMTDGMRVLNDLLDSLSTDKLFVYTANESILAWTPGQYQYTIGNPVAGNFTAYTTSGSPTLTGVTNLASLSITYGLNASGVTVGGTLTDIQGAIPSGTTIVSSNAGNLYSTFFTANPTGVSGTLNGNWPYAGGTCLLSFSDGETRTGTVTQGSPAVTWFPALTGAPALPVTINTATLTMSANATQTLTSADTIQYTSPGNFAIARPLRVRAGYTRITSSGNTGLDYWWDVCSLDDYNEIGYKGVPGPWPYLVCYQPTFPLGTIWVYPNPQTAGQVFLWTDVILSEFTTPYQQISLPQGYNRALKKLLALELAPEYGKTPGAELLRQANEARNLIKGLNETPVKKLRYDSILMNGSGRDASWIFSGGFNSNL